MTIRPWTPSEVPVGAVVRSRNRSVEPKLRLLITGLEPNGQTIHFTSGNKSDPQKMLSFWEWRWPHEADDQWKPCGVEE